MNICVHVQNLLFGELLEGEGDAPFLFVGKIEQAVLRSLANVGYETLTEFQNCVEDYLGRLYPFLKLSIMRNADSVYALYS